MGKGQGSGRKEGGTEVCFYMGVFVHRFALSGVCVLGFDVFGSSQDCLPKQKGLWL